MMMMGRSISRGNVISVGMSSGSYNSFNFVVMMRVRRSNSGGLNFFRNNSSRRCNSSRNMFMSMRMSVSKGSDVSMFFYMSVIMRVIKCSDMSMFINMSVIVRMVKGGNMSMFRTMDMSMDVMVRCSQSRSSNTF